MSSQLKTAVVVDDSAIAAGLTIDDIDFTVPFEEIQAQLRDGQVSVSAADTHVKHLEDALVGASGKTKLTKQDTGADESLEIDLDATSVTSGHVPTANGAGGWAWSSPGGGGATPIDVTGTAGEALALRDYVYLDESVGTWFKVDVDESAAIRCGRVRGIVTEALGIAGAATGTIRLLGEISGYAGLTAGATVYASATAGGITQTRPSPTSGGAQVAIIELGIAVSTTNIVLLPPKPVQYMKRDNALADEGTLTIEHHPDAMGHTRKPKAYLGSSEAGATLTSYASSNQDSDVKLKSRVLATYTADQCTGGTAIGNMTGVGGSLASAFDNNSSTYAINNASTGQIGYDFGAGNTKSIRQYTVQEAGGTSETAAPEAWTFEYSDNNTDWTVADTVTGQTGWTNTQKRTFQFNVDTGAHRYWRVNISDNNGSPNTIVAEVEMMEIDTWTNGADRLAQGFQVGSVATVGMVRLWLKKSSSPAGNLTVKIYTDSGGDPDALVTDGTSNTVAASTLATSYGWIDFSFSTPPSLSASTQYHIVLETADSHDEFDYVVWGADGSAPGYGSGEMKSEASAVWSAESKDAIFDVLSDGTTFVEPAVVGRWSGGTRDIAYRYDDGSGGSGTTQTTGKNVTGSSADVTLVVEVA